MVKNSAALLFIVLLILASQQPAEASPMKRGICKVAYYGICQPLYKFNQFLERRLLRTMDFFEHVHDADYRAHLFDLEQRAAKKKAKEVGYGPLYKDSATWRHIESEKLIKAHERLQARIRKAARYDDESWAKVQEEYRQVTARSERFHNANTRFFKGEDE